MVKLSKKHLEAADEQVRMYLKHLAWMFEDSSKTEYKKEEIVELLRVCADDFEHKPEDIIMTRLQEWTNGIKK